MAFLSALKGAWKGAGSSLSGARALAPFAGSAVGGVHGYLTSENLDPTARMKDTMLGAMGGAGIGALATKTAWRGVAGIGKGVARGIWKNKRGIGKAGIIGAKTGIRLGASLAKSAMNHPYAAMALGGGVYGIRAMAGGGEQGRPVDRAEMMIGDQAPSTGRIADGSRQDLLESTFGLTQGMWKGRHG